ncbi:MAG: hypothetical protein H6577_18170 [Lewinellaceae bacterium]|nr:hypothetical protein [Saprospiraceae bacterium]MCB9340052.1 hypothetical protein [Lewinellaceae bacterium]
MIPVTQHRFLYSAFSTASDLHHFLLPILLVPLLLADGFGQTFASFTNTQQITIPDIGTAAPYPSTITVSGQPDYLTDLTIAFEQVFHGGGLANPWHRFPARPSGRIFRNHFQKPPVPAHSRCEG